MKRRSTGQAAAAAAGMVLLIIDSRTAFKGASDGVALCIRTVIPSLFPFLFLSGVFSGACQGSAYPVSMLSRLLGIPENAGGLLVPALLGGYPAGAQCIGEAYHAGTISSQQAQKMLAYCSNAGPSFIFGVLPAVFPTLRPVFFTWGIQLFSIWSASVIFSPGNESCTARSRERHIPAIERSCSAMGKICAWVVLFRVVIAFLDRWAFRFVPAEGQVLLAGMLELSNGCCMLANIGSECIRFVLCNGLLALGGLCVVYQTASVCQGLSLRSYILGKVFQSIVATVTAGAVAAGRWGIPAAIFSALLLLKKMKKRSSDSVANGV